MPAPVRAGKSLRLTVQRDRRRTAFAANHFDIGPLDAVRPPGPERLEHRLFRSETRGDVRHGIATRLAVGALALGQDPTQETFAVARQQVADPIQLGDVDPDPCDHVSPEALSVPTAGKDSTHPVLFV